jgi:hypothetical protein
MAALSHPLDITEGQPVGHCNATAQKLIQTRCTRGASIAR